MIKFINVKTKKIMRRILFAVLICCLLLTLMQGLFSCKNDSNDSTPSSGSDNAISQSSHTESAYTSKEVADAIMAAYSPEELPEAGMSYYFSGADEDSDNYIDPEKIGNVVNGKPLPVDGMEYVEDFALYIPGGKNVFEVDVLRLKESENQNIDSIKSIVDNRLERKKQARGDVMNYASEDLPLLENAKVIVVNNYAILLATTDNAKAESVINGMIKSNNNPSFAGITTEPADISISVPADGPKPASMDEVVNIEPEILFDIDRLPAEDKNIETAESPQDAPALRKTPVPNVTVKIYSHNTSLAVGGKCEAGAMIRVTGGTEEIYTSSDYGDFIVEVPFAETGSSVLKLTAETDGKSPSEEITFIVKPQTNVTLFEDGGIYGNVVGYNFQYFCADSLDSYLGTDLLKDSEIASLQTRMEKKVQDLRDKGCNAEIIYLLIPNPMRIYAEDAPKRYIQNTGETLRTQWESAVRAGGATVIDLTDLFMEHKNDGFKLFQKTDTHWSEYGAMLGYNALMSYIGQKFPDALPRPASDFEVSNKEFYWGDMFSRFNLQPSDLRETTAVVKFNFDPPGKRLNLYQSGNSLNLVHALVSMEQTTHTNLTGKFPSAYIYRDSFAGPLHDFITDRFSTATFRNMWDYGWKSSEIASTNPDYVLYIINERNIRNVMYE